MNKELSPKEKTYKVELVNRALDGDQDALRKILFGNEMIVIEQPVSGKTIADGDVDVRVVAMEDADEAGVPQ